MIAVNQHLTICLAVKCCHFSEIPSSTASNQLKILVSESCGLLHRKSNLASFHLRHSVVNVNIQRHHKHACTNFNHLNRKYMVLLGHYIQDPLSFN